MTSRETLLVIPNCLILIIELHKENKRNFIMFRILRELKKICRINLSLLTRPPGRINLYFVTRPVGRINLSLATRPLCRFVRFSSTGEEGQPQQFLVRATFFSFSRLSHPQNLSFSLLYLSK